MFFFSLSLSIYLSIYLSIRKEGLLAGKELWQTTCDHCETDNREGSLPIQGGEKPWDCSRLCNMLQDVISNVGEYLLTSLSGRRRDIYDEMRGI